MKKCLYCGKDLEKEPKENFGENPPIEASPMGNLLDSRKEC